MDDKRKRQIAFVVTPEQGERIDHVEADQGLSVAGLVRHLVVTNLPRREQPVSAR
jgi:hypothetical protein